MDDLTANTVCRDMSRVSRSNFDASFKRALPILTHYVRPEDMKGARQVLRAAAFTYVAAALVSLIDVARWVRILRF